MTIWEQRVLAALDAVNALRTSLEDLQDSGGVDTSQLDGVERIADVQRYAEGVLTRTELHYLFPPQAIKTIAQYLKAAATEVSSFRANKGGQHIVNANNHIDSMLPVLLQLPAPFPSEQVEGLRESVISFRRSAGQHLSSIERQSESLSAALNVLKEKVAEVHADVSQQKSRLDTAITEYQQQYSQAESERRESFSKLLSDSKASFAAEIESAQGETEEEVEQLRQKIEATTDEQERAFEKSLNSLDNQARAQISALEGFRDQAQELLQVIGSTGMAGEFQKAAQSAKRTGWLWQGISVAAMAGLIIFAVLAYLSASKNGVDWADVGTRIFVAVSFAILAGFSVRQADRYHESELRNRRYQLELSSIDPYLAGLPHDKRDEVKIRLADRLFGTAGAHGLDSRSGDSAGGGTSIDVVKLSLETIQELIKQRK